MTTQITEYSKTDAALAELAQRYTKAVYDVVTTKGMQDAKAARAELRSYRVDLEKVRVEIKAPALERCRLIDAEAKRITAALVDLEDPIDDQIKREEKRKEDEAMAKAMENQRRINAIQALIEAMRGKALQLAGKQSAAVASALEVLESTEITEAEFMEFTAEAQTAKDAALVRIRELHAQALAQEAEAQRIVAEREELAKLRAESEQRERERNAEQAAARKAMEDEQRASRLQIEADNRAAREARAIEDNRVAAERAQIEAERHAAEAARREIQRKENEVLTARELLVVFKQRFGHLGEFAAVVAAIDTVLPKRARKVA